ncbi:unnamed protein product, partial [Pylaiella littoralis]
CSPARGFGAAPYVRSVSRASWQSNSIGDRALSCFSQQRPCAPAAARRRARAVVSGSTEEIQGEIVPPAPDDIRAGGEGEQQRPTADAGNLIRALTGPEVSVALGIGLLLAVLANRIATPDLVDSQARTDILGVIASGGLVTNGVYLLVCGGHARSLIHYRNCCCCCCC